MTDLVTIELNKIVPNPGAVLEAQGIPSDTAVDGRIHRLVENAIQSYRAIAAPKGIMAEIEADEAAAIYEGEGANARPAVLDEILPHAVSLSLFAVTLGRAITEEIRATIARNEFAEAVMLDAAASCGADLAAEQVETMREEALRRNGVIVPSHGVLRFSPGYCGWHVSGQRKLFARLDPARIGITLAESCLMLPLKSVSGLIVAAPVERFDIDDTYPFCADCANHTCLDRYQALKQKHLTRNTGS
jgi:hypothetical protein